jgi:hypothetical protein
MADSGMTDFLAPLLHRRQFHAMSATKDSKGGYDLNLSFLESTKHEPPRWGGYVTLKLCQSSMAWGRRGLVAVRISVTTWLGS